MRRNPLLSRFTQLSVLVALAAGGCTNSDNAQQLALATLKVTANYENQIDEKISAEKRFYKDQLENIRVSLGGVPMDTKLSDQDREEKLRKTWLYAHMRVNAARDGLMTAGNILSQDEALSWGLMIAFLEKGIRDDVNSIADARAKQASLEEQFVKALAPLKKQKKRLKKIRKGLSTLAAGRGEGDRFTLAMTLALAEEIK